MSENSTIHKNKSLLLDLILKSLLLLFLFNAIPIVDFVDVLPSTYKLEMFAESSFSEVKEIEEEEVILNEHNFVESETLVFVAHMPSVKPLYFVQGILIPPPESI